MDSTETVDDFDSAFEEFAEVETSAELLPEEVVEEVVEEVLEEAPPEPEQDDIWAGADDTLKSEYDKLRDNNDKLSHQAKSNAGRIGAFTRRWCYTIRDRSG